MSKKPKPCTVCGVEDVITKTWCHSCRTLIYNAWSRKKSSFQCYIGKRPGVPCSHRKCMADFAGISLPAGLSKEKQYADAPLVEDDALP